MTHFYYIYLYIPQEYIIYCVCSLQIKIISLSIEYITITESLKFGLYGSLRGRMNNIHTNIITVIYALFKKFLFRFYIFYRLNSSRFPNIIII